MIRIYTYDNKILRKSVKVSPQKAVLRLPKLILTENQGRVSRFRFLLKEAIGGNFSALRFITRMKPISEMAEKSHFQRLNYYLKCLPSVQF